MTLIALFWAQVVLFAGNAALLGFNLRRRRWRGAELSALAMIVAAVMAGVMWGREGTCVFPHPSPVPYQAGMTLCPGQSADVIITLPRGRNL